MCWTRVTSRALIRNQRQWGRESGIVTNMPPYGLVFTIRDGKVVRWRPYPNKESALGAVGLRSRRRRRTKTGISRRFVRDHDQAGLYCCRLRLPEGRP